MKYRVNEIFYSLQGEGFWTGTPMVFVRLALCNLKCPFCDTNHSHGVEMTADEIVAEALRVGEGCHFLCLTGGEPSLQADKALTDAFHRAGYRIHIETNGTRPLPEGIDWVTISPKGPVVLTEADELKLVFGAGEEPEKWLSFNAKWHFLQPCDFSDKAKSQENLRQCIEYVKAHSSHWRLSLQTHKFTNIR